MKFSSIFSAGALLAAAAASPIASDIKITSRDGYTLTQEQLNQLKFFSQYSAAAYCLNNNNSPNTPLDCSPESCPAVEAAAATTLAEWTATLATGQTGYLAIDPTNKLIVLGFRGSGSVRNWVTNFDFLTVDFAAAGCSGCKVHQGFSNAYRESVPKFMPALVAARAQYPSYKLIVTGHSLGAAVATIAGATLRAQGIPADIFSYASPRPGNWEFATWVSAQAGLTARVTHVADPVPRLPFLFLGFRHTSPEFWLSTGASDNTQFTPADVKVCEGVATTACNAGGLLKLDFTAHVYYLGPISACAPDFAFRKGRRQAAAAAVGAAVGAEMPIDVSQGHVNLTETEWKDLITQDMAYAETLDAEGRVA